MYFYNFLASTHLGHNKSLYILIRKDSADRKKEDFMHYVVKILQTAEIENKLSLEDKKLIGRAIFRGFLRISASWEDICNFCLKAGIGRLDSRKGVRLYGFLERTSHYFDNISFLKLLPAQEEIIEHALMDDMEMRPSVKEALARCGVVFFDDGSRDLSMYEIATMFQRKVPPQKNKKRKGIWQGEKERVRKWRFRDEYSED